MAHKTYSFTAPYSTGIYDNCDMTLVVWGDGKAARFEMDNVIWRGQSGFLNRSKQHIQGRKNVRKITRLWRKGMALNLRNGFGAHDESGINESTWEFLLNLKGVYV